MARKPPRRTAPPLRVLVADIGGTHVKCYCSGIRAAREFESGPRMTARKFVQALARATGDWRYDVVSLGYPGPVAHGRPLRDPPNLAAGWVNFDFGRALKRPVRIINDAAMQALGSYAGGRMLFIGLGTGLGSALILDGVIAPMELGHLPYRKRTYEDYVGIRGLKKLGGRKWRREVDRVVTLFSAALQPDYVVLGGGNAARLRRPPLNARVVDNARAFAGGVRLWAGSRARNAMKHACVAVQNR